MANSLIDSNKNMVTLTTIFNFFLNFLQPFGSRKNIVSATGSAVAITMIIQTISREFFGPNGFKSFMLTALKNILTKLIPQLTMVIEEYNGLTTNQIYRAAEIYLDSKSIASTTRLKIYKDDNGNDYMISVDKTEGIEIIDVFEGIRFKWRFFSKGNGTRSYQSYAPTRTPSMNSDSDRRSEGRCLELTFYKKYKEKVLNSYFPHIMNTTKDIKKDNKIVKLYTMNKDSQYAYGPWSSIILDHPATFEKLAMDNIEKKKIIDDLDRFVKRKEFYRSVGKAWKRGYLLYGPPGTGKSSLIAAMANYLNFDIYDLELTDIRRNSDLRRLLVSTGNRSIIVVEDIDCSLDFNKRKALPAKAATPSPGTPTPVDNHLTLSGMLNFIDGLWSSCGNERIIVFTTNNKDKLDPALLRPGRMDVHIHMSYCTPSGFELLAYNYLKVSHHGVFKEIKKLLETTNVTPAEVAETLMKNEDPDVSLEELLGILQNKNLETATSSADLCCLVSGYPLNNLPEDLQRSEIYFLTLYTLPRVSNDLSTVFMESYVKCISMSNTTNLAGQF